MYAYETHAHEVHAHKMHAHEMYDGKILSIPRVMPGQRLVGPSVRIGHRSSGFLSCQGNGLREDGKKLRL
jgi:hypothetical protein